MGTNGSVSGCFSGPTLDAHLTGLGYVPGERVDWQRECKWKSCDTVDTRRPKKKALIFRAISLLSFTSSFSRPNRNDWWCAESTGTQSRRMGRARSGPIHFESSKRERRLFPFKYFEQLLADVSTRRPFLDDVQKRHRGDPKKLFAFMLATATSRLLGSLNEITSLRVGSFAQTRAGF